MTGLPDPARPTDAARPARWRSVAAALAGTVVLAGCIPDGPDLSGEPADEPPPTTEQQPDAAPVDGTDPLVLRRAAYDVCTALSASFEYAFNTLRDADDVDRATALVTETRSRVGAVDIPASLTDDVDRIIRGTELIVATSGFDVDGVDPVQPDERDDAGDPKDLWVHLSSDEAATAFSAAPPCVDLALQQGDTSLFATDGRWEDIPVPPTDGRDLLDAFDAFEELRVRAFVLAVRLELYATDHNPDDPDAAPPTLRTPEFIEQVLDPLPQFALTSTDLLTDAGLVTIELDPATEGAAELTGPPAGTSDAPDGDADDDDPLTDALRSRTDGTDGDADPQPWCVAIPETLDDGVVLWVPGDCADPQVRDTVDAAVAESIENDGFDEGLPFGDDPEPEAQAAGGGPLP